MEYLSIKLATIRQRRFFMIKILGILDLLAAALLTGIALGIEIPTGVLIFIPACLFLKACVFISDPGSMADFIIVMLFVSNVFFNYPSLDFVSWNSLFRG